MLTLDDVDRRTRAYRATIELRDSIYSDRGGRDRMSVLEVELADSLAVQCAMIRDIEARWLQGEEIDLTAYATMLNARRREATQLGVERVARDVTPPLRDYIASKAQGAA